LKNKDTKLALLISNFVGLKNLFMKKLITLLLFVLVFTSVSLYSQERNQPLTHEMTPEEMLRKNEIGRDFTPTEPPPPPVRSVAEFEEMQSVLVRYPFGIPMSLIVEMSQDCKVKTIVGNASQQQQVLSQYESAGVNTANCEWLIAPSDSYWTRDYGPWFVADGNNDIGISDFPYNRPRPNDDNIPVVLAQQMGIPLYGMELIHTGGNWMDDGMGIAASTQLVWAENPTLSHADIDTLVKDYLGITKYHVLDDPLDEYIEHIDCWGKFLDVDKILIGQVPQSDYRYADYEAIANYWALQTSSYGNHYQVYRVYTPGTYPYTPYTNSLILNKKVFVPITGSQYDDEALEVYQEAMPGYEIVSVLFDTWENTDALHCRAKGIADVGMLYVKHMPILGNKPFSMEWDLSAEIIPFSGMGLINDSLLCYYKVNDGDYQAVTIEHTTGYNYEATIPLMEPGSEVSYYLHAVDLSGRRKNHPYIGSPDPHVFSVGYAALTVVYPDSMIYVNYGEMVTGKTFNICNYTNTELMINDIESEGFGNFHWYIEGFDMTFPYTMTMNETLPLTVKIDLPVDQALGFMVTDTLDILAEDGHYKVIIRVDSDLLNGIANPLISAAKIESISPNPFSSVTRISFSLKEEMTLTAAVCNLQGQVVRILASREYPAGSHEITWDGTDGSGNSVPDGIYLLKLETERGMDFKKLIISK
jgi:agmatine deiminase